MVIQGSSTTCAPIYVNKIKSATKNQNNTLPNGLNCILLILQKCICGSANKTSNDANNAITPSSLFGIDRNIAYGNKKYHSGCI